MWISVLLVHFFVLFAESSSSIHKCCPIGYAFNDHLKCVISTRSNNQTFFKELSSENRTEFEQNCYRSGESANELQDAESRYGQNFTNVDWCQDVHHLNGTVYFKACPIDWRERIGKCDSIFTSMSLWGVSHVCFTSLVYIFPYIIVVVFYFFIPDLRHRAYDKAVLTFNMIQILISLVLLGMGYFILCHKPVHQVWVYTVAGTALQFSVISSSLWVNVLSFDMTLVITRFRWIPGSDITGSGENKKFRMYCAYAFGVGFIATIVTCFVELCPWIPNTSYMKPHFERFDDATNYTVIIYAFTVPVISFVLNNIFFVYTTYKIIKIKQSTTAANENITTAAKRKYFMFLRLYLLMDAPWLFALLPSFYAELWILKLGFMLQPMLMLLAILPKKRFGRAMKCNRSAMTRIQTKNKNTGMPC